jgi:hypothetical protein
MATQLSIINLAFSHLAEPLVSTLEGDPRPPNVVKALAQWGQALETALCQAGWLCALESRRATPDVTAPNDWRYSHRFTLPVGTLKVWNVEGGDTFAWQAGVNEAPGGAVTRVIRAAHSGPLLVDVIMMRRPEALTPLLADALAWELAARLAGPIQSSEAKAKWAADKAATAYERAASAEATEIGGQDPVVGLGAMGRARRAAG